MGKKTKGDKMSAICGGGHRNIKTKEEVIKHILKYDNPDNKETFGACMDCCCGISFGCEEESYKR